LVNNETSTTERNERNKQEMKTPYSRFLNQALTVAFISVLPLAYGQTFKTEPDKTMAAAHDSFVKGETKKAGEDIDKATDYVKKQSQHVAAGSKADMDKAGDELDKLGKGIKSGTVKSEAELKKTFAKVDHQMATSWHKTAEEAQKMGKDSKADLDKAGAALEGAAKWSGNQLDEGTHKTLDAVKHAGKASSDQVQKWWKSMGDSIDDLGNKL
jgi:hypothetical protein